MKAMSSFLQSLLCLLALLSPGVAVAQDRTSQPAHIAAGLVAEGPAMPGATAWLAIHMRPDPGWHGYWLNPGDAGLGMRLEWTLPEGFAAGEAEYPVPSTLLVSGLMNHVYKGDHAVLVPLRIPAHLPAGGSVPVVLDAQWLACTDTVCVPERGRMAIRLRLGGAGRADPRFATWRARLPAPLGAPGRFAIAGDTLRLAIPLPHSAALDAPHLFVATDRAIDYAAPQRFSRSGDTLVVELKRAAVAPVSPRSVEAVLRMDNSGIGLSVAARPGDVPPSGVALSPAGKSPALASLPLLLLGALLGGLLLNVMPCVFPILGLKAVSLARAGESDASARREGLAYAGGVIAACLALGGLLLSLRAAGEQVGWAFQLQEPLTVALLLLLASAITANFLGLFEVALPGRLGEDSPRGAFATGALAAFVATPCTGPFMAAAMGAALLLPVAPALMLFAALGLGLALPFLALAFAPALRRMLPRPGPWMARFRRWMALPMGLTAIALAWLAWRIGGVPFAIAACLVALACVAGLWQVGRLQRAGRPAFRTALVAALLPLIATTQLGRIADAPGSRRDPGVLSAEPFSEARLAAARASGRPVFVWMTADWCLTCKVNESTAIEREDTSAAFREARVIVLRGDWTRRDPEITRFLTAHGAAGVPFYMWFPARGATPEQLPQVLTRSILIELAGRDRQ